MTDTHAPTAVARDRKVEQQAWREDRLRALVAPQGNLALIETRWLPGGVTVTDEEALAGQPSTVSLTRLARTNIDNGQPEHGLRLWDANSAAIQHFETVSLFDFNPDWIIDAQFTPVASDRTIPFEHIRDNGGSRDLVVPGDITFTRDGRDYSLSAFDDGGILLLVFGDPTNGRPAEDGGTYGSGRFLFVERPSSDAAFDAEGPVVLDFNRAFVPPCGFSNSYNCPLPPAQNRFPDDVDAGERLVVFRDGYELH